MPVKMEQEQRRTLADISKEELIRALHYRANELRQGIDAYTDLVASILKEGVDEPHLYPFLEFCPFRSREHRMKEAIREAIDALEESRKSFKSKQLESLRKKLTQVLIDAD